MNKELDFLFEEPNLSFRAIKRKGDLRYISSPRRGSLESMTRFAPPSAPLPKQALRLASLIDFRIPQFLNWTVSLRVSERFLKQTAALLEIPVERVGIYIGEPNDRRKLVVIDTAGEAGRVLKLAVGSLATVAIQKELRALESVSCASLEEPGRTVQVSFADEGRLTAARSLRTPKVQQVAPICDREAILIERIQGRPLTPDEFEDEFFRGGCRLWAWGFGQYEQKELNTSNSIILSDWIRQIPVTDSLSPFIATCRETEAFSLRTALGMIHGDFAPWNIIRQKMDGGFGHQAAGLRNSNHSLLSGTHSPKPSTLCAIDWEFSREDAPLLFDIAYAAWCYSELLGRAAQRMDPTLWTQLVALGALWKELRQQL